MILALLISMMIILISNIMMFLSIILSKNSNNKREKYSPFECGFDPLSSPRIPFSLHFFLITVIFLIFDIEIALILPMILTFNLTNMFYWISMSMFFFIILLIGVYHEWNQNMLNWSI